MPGYVVGLLAAVAVAVVVFTVVVFAVIAIRTEWILPWLRRSTLRPRLWGYSALFGGAGLGLWCFAHAIHRPALFSAAAVGLFVVSTGLSFRATRPGRVPR
ncbi:hypothetical protein [Streptomyces ipomoeae]|uniref:hypothetical protein n=1 Tax=Streptomyces ipomoeae TaxID=103232 RepID=UPI00114680AB|nr:hypothetical protein [Streptomyces ipomoeae]TQE25063.1 hypothetical protein Sipo7851_35230 [Streptomyces ipomoeae]